MTNDLRIPSAIIRLHSLMAQLRSPTGCPWDLEQTPESLIPYIIEEAYELVEAIDTKQPGPICDELGDLLLQVVFQSRIYEERGHFDLADVADAISEKLIRRHPHVFDGEAAHSMDELNARWDHIKTQEHNRKGEPRSTLGGIPASLPALIRARKLTEKASRAGLDWPDHHTVLAKVEEELEELRQAMKTGTPDDREAELGDLLFAISNLGRTLGIDPESALRKSLNRFESRFIALETTLGLQEKNIRETSSINLLELWQEVKKKTD